MTPARQIDLTPLIAALAELFPGVQAGPPPPCRECGHPDLRVQAERLCSACYERWRRAGYPESVPPRQRRAKRKGSGFEDFRRARELGASVPQAARNARIPEYVGWRYDTRIREAAQSAA